MRVLNLADVSLGDDGFAAIAKPLITLSVKDEEEGSDDEEKEEDGGKEENTSNLLEELYLGYNELTSESNLVLSKLLIGKPHLRY